MMEHNFSVFFKNFVGCYVSLFDFFFFFFFQGLENGNEKTYMWLSRLGSRPPNCQHKCEGCIPCDPIQTPTTTDQIGVQYANYVPEGWKCKCGTSFFNP